MKTSRAFVIFIGILGLIGYMYPQNLSDIYLLNYEVDAVCLIICTILLLKEYTLNRLDIFDPLTIVSAIYLTMYFIAPMRDMSVGIYEWYGYSLFQYGPLTSFYEFLGYLAFFFGYKKAKPFLEKYKNRRSIITCNRETMKRISLIVYTVCFIANVFYMQAVGGSSLSYILTLGLMGSANPSEATDVSLGFISMLSYSLPTATLMCWEYNDNKRLKTWLFILMFMLQVTRGFRFFVVQIAITFLAYIYLKKSSRPTMKAIAVYCVAFMIPILLMTMFRDTIRAGQGMDITFIDKESSGDAFEAAVWENFRIYQNVYGMVAKIPNQYPYCYFDEIVIGTAVMFVPRILWPNKPSMYGGEGLAVIIGDNIGNGQAYPSIGEFYYSMGVFGIVFYMWLYGYWMGRVRQKYKTEGKNADGLDIILFAVLIGTNIQLIIRGYMPSNFWYVVFVVLPIYYARKKRIIRYLN